MKRIVIKALVLMGLFIGVFQTNDAKAAEVVSLDTRSGVKQKFILIKPDRPVAAVILFAGGDGL